MKYIDLFSEIAGDMTGEPYDVIKNRMTFYDQNIEKNDVLFHDVLPEHEEKLRSAAKKDPNGFFKWVFAEFKLS